MRLLIDICKEIEAHITCDEGACADCDFLRKINRGLYELMESSDPEKVRDDRVRHPRRRS